MQTVYKLSLFNAAPALLLCLYLIAVGTLVCWFGVFGSRQKKGVIRLALPVFLSALFIVLGSVSLIGTLRLFHRYQTAMRNGECRIVEGTVEVLELNGRRQAEHIRIGTNDFTFHNEGLAYHWVVREGGPLTNGACARLHVFDEHILKVEIKR